jgi:CheY-like chemotaxis protein
MILAVEDNDGLRRVVVRQLRDLGYRVFEADSAAAALSFLAKEKADLVFTDVVMPGEVDGFMLAKTVLEEYPSIKVVLTSGFPDTKLNGALSALKDQVRLLSKPYRKDELAHLLREVLER